MKFWKFAIKEKNWFFFVQENLWYWREKTHLITESIDEAKEYMKELKRIKQKNKKNLITFTI